MSPQHGERLGQLAEIWRYPVKSLGGEGISSSELSGLGVCGDRAWAVRDEVRGGIRGAKKLPRLMQLRARYLAPPTDGSVAAEIALPDGSCVETSDPEVHARISRAIDHEVTLWPRLPADQLDHYRRGAPTHADPGEELRAIFGRDPDEPLPNLAVFPRELIEFESPPGTYFDAYPLLLVTRASLREMARRAPASHFDVRRFRPNLVVESLREDGFPEQEWEGALLRLGEATLRATIGCPRCVMITHGFGELPQDRSIMRSLVREAGGLLGLYARVEQRGRVQLGDVLERVAE